MKPRAYAAKSKSPRLSDLLFLIGQSYHKKAWHGTTLRGSLRGITAKQAGWRPAKGRHNIREIVVHCAYWKYIVRRRILNEKRGSFPLKGSNWFRLPELNADAEWSQEIMLLDACHAALVDTVNQLRDGDLDRIPRGSTLNNLAVIAGIASHDLYHAGQIQLLKRLQRR